MTEFRFDKNYRNVEQVRPFMAAYLARYEALRADGHYPYNALFKGYLGADFATERDEDAAIYLCQTLRELDALAIKVADALADGYVPAELVTRPAKCRVIVDYGYYMSGTGWREYHDARLVDLNGSLVAMPKGARTRGHLLDGKVLVKI
jgi:hypothetical protein